MADSLQTPPPDALLPLSLPPPSRDSLRRINRPSQNGRWRISTRRNNSMTVVAHSGGELYRSYIGDAAATNKMLTAIKGNKQKRHFILLLLADMGGAALGQIKGQCKESDSRPSIVVGVVRAAIDMAGADKGPRSLRQRQNSPKNTTTIRRYVDYGVTDCHRNIRTDSRARRRWSPESKRQKTEDRCDATRWRRRGGDRTSLPKCARQQGATPMRGSRKAERQASAGETGRKKKRRTRDTC